MKSRLQLPVLHCTGNIAEVITYFVLECLPEVVQNDARASLLAITGKGKMDALYLRECRELVALTAARPAIFPRDLDCVFVIVLQLTQLLNAAWRGSLTDEEVNNRDGAGSIARLTASIMGPLCREAAVLSDLAGLCDATIKFSTPRSHPSSLVYTKHIRLCKCWKTVGRHGAAEFEALQTIAIGDPNLLVESRNGGAELYFTLLLHDVVDANKAKRFEPSGIPRTGKKEYLRRGLRKRQEVVTACFCGALTGTDFSSFIAVARARRAAKEAKAAKAAAAGAVASSGGESQVESGTEAPTGAQRRAVNANKARERSVIPSVRRALPPLWLLHKVLPTPAAYATVREIATGGIDEPAPDVVEAFIRRHVAYLHCFLLRTKTPQYALWVAQTKIHPAHVREATETVLERLATLASNNVLFRATDVVMDVQ
ncbi:hypothetical protein I4F81_004459 [Pyropia yezoensis]|uniref:Uncharacterized protein n=1 Tax=Pyropia yezoensis TaxID=2788 RepID=A0ACC3BVG3_PYRYE|nr:hypothetical protein I4F81_004459 [Neopyropia yezoensis]